MIITTLEFLDLVALDRDTLELWIEEQWLLPERADAELVFSDADVARARLIRDLKQVMGVNDDGVSVILHLIDEMHGLRKALATALQTARGRPVQFEESSGERGHDRP